MSLTISRDAQPNQMLLLRSEQQKIEKILN